MPGHDAPETVPQATATAAAGAIATAVVRVADGRRLIDGPAVRHVLPRDVRNLPAWRSRLGRSRSLAKSGEAPRFSVITIERGQKSRSRLLRQSRVATRAQLHDFTKMRHETRDFFSDKRAFCRFFFFLSFVAQRNVAAPACL